MRKAGVAESVIMRITGHSTGEMFDRYNTINEYDTRSAVAQIINKIKNGSSDIKRALFSPGCIFAYQLYMNSIPFITPILPPMPILC
jgi:hypothetical protein